MQFMTKPGGKVDQGPCWFTTSPEQLRREAETVVRLRRARKVITRRNGRIVRVSYPREV